MSPRLFSFHSSYVGTPKLDCYFLRLDYPFAFLSEKQLSTSGFPPSSIWDNEPFRKDEMSTQTRIKFISPNRKNAESHHWNNSLGYFH